MTLFWLSHYTPFPPFPLLRLRVLRFTGEWSSTGGSVANSLSTAIFSDEVNCTGAGVTVDVGVGTGRRFEGVA